MASRPRITPATSITRMSPGAFPRELAPAVDPPAMPGATTGALESKP